MAGLARPLEGHGVRLEPLATAHHDDLLAAASDGRLWDLWYTPAPEPEEVATSIAGTTRHHDIIADIGRVEIGYTRYAKRWQRTHVNTACKLLLFEHALGRLGCHGAGLRTDSFNFASQRAIDALGAKQNGVIRHQHRRRDGTARDTVMCGVLASGWPAVKRHLRFRLERRGGSR